MAPPTFQLTPAQQKALDHRRNIAVTASAGSGKTATLVERYLELLRAHPTIGPRNILAITFTQKAAAEMRERLRQRLDQALTQAPPSTANRLEALVDELPAARISTIHAFCAAVLREFPLEAGVDPAFAVLEQVEATRLRREAVAESLEALARRPDGDPVKEDLASLVREWGRPYLENLLISLVDKRRVAGQWLHR